MVSYVTMAEIAENGRVSSFGNTGCKKPDWYMQLAIRRRDVRQECSPTLAPYCPQGWSDRTSPGGSGGHSVARDEAGQLDGATGAVNLAATDKWRGDDDRPLEAETGGGRTKLCVSRDKTGNRRPHDINWCGGDCGCRLRAGVGIDVGIRLGQGGARDGADRHAGDGEGQGKAGGGVHGGSLFHNRCGGNSTLFVDSGYAANCRAVQRTTSHGRCEVDHTWLDGARSTAWRWAMTRAKYQRIARLYDLLDLPFEFSRYRPIRRHLFAGISGRLLDAGVGTGRNFDFYPEGAEVVGIDLSAAMLHRARQRRDRTGARVDLVEMDVLRTAFSEGHFDAIVATFLFCVLDDSLQLPALAELRRICKPGGTIRLLEYTLSEDPWKRRIMRLWAPWVRFVYGATFDRRTEQYMPAAGLEIVEERFLFQDIVKLIVARRDDA